MAPSTVPSMIQDLLKVQRLEEAVKESYGIVVERQTKDISLGQEILEDPIIPAILKAHQRKISEQACQPSTYF